MLALVEHMPLYRQVQRFNREGITLASSTLGDWITASVDLLVPLYEALAGEMLNSGYIQTNETPIQVQDYQKSGTTHRGYNLSTFPYAPAIEPSVIRFVFLDPHRFVNPTHVPHGSVRPGACQ